MLRTLSLGLLLAISPALMAQQLAPTAHGTQLLDQYLREQVRQISENCLSRLTTQADWERQRPEMRRQFLEMIGLWPMPARTDLRVRLTGKTETPKFSVERLHFQSAPGLYVTANLYVPKPAPEKAPAILYVCGHGNTKENGISYGSKVSYQRHPAWFAEHGYVCLVLDTLQLGEIEGLHHGTYRAGMWWWQTLGYTPAGIECWNGLRALDYLQSRPEVDGERLGVTGRSGGGATSWWIAAADDRVKAIVPVAGIADLYAHVVEGELPPHSKGVISGHCDCMFPVNTYRWDFAQVAALCAPRPLLLGNSDVDTIFPVGGYRRLADKVRKVYDLYGAADKFQLLETKGPHKDTPELRTGAFRWMNRWLKGDGSPVTDDEPAKLRPEELRVFDKLPPDQLNTRIHEVFIRPAEPELPRLPAVVKEWWPGQKQLWEQHLGQKVFAGWPSQPPPLAPKLVGEKVDQGVRLRAYEFLSEAGVPLRVWVSSAEQTENPKLLVLNVLDEAGWAEWCADLGEPFGELLLADKPKRDEKKFTQNQRVMEKFGWAFAAIPPRGIGPTRWATPGTPADIHVRRRFALLGQTLAGQQIWDVRRALAVLREASEYKDVKTWLQGKGESAGLALYAGLYEPSVERLDLWNLPASHAVGPTLLNVRRELDIPQALAMLSPRRAILYVRNKAEEAQFEWAFRLQAALGVDTLKVRIVGD